MSQRNSHRRNAAIHRPEAIAGLLRVRGTLITGLLVLVLLITNGGAG